jgi:hypothetical protein
MNRHGAVIWAHDFGPYWVRLASKARLTTLGLHPIPSAKGDGPRSLESFLETIETVSFKRDARELHEQGVDLEAEMHAMQRLMPRKKFGSHPGWFAMNVEGTRSGDSDFCPSNEYAPQYIEYDFSPSECCPPSRYFPRVRPNRKSLALRTG